MGGAFLAVSDDSTASSWNPAGLIYIDKPEISFSFTYNNLKRIVPSYEYTGQQYGYSTQYKVLNRKSKSLGKYFNYLSIAYPFKIFRREIVSQLSYQRRIPFSLTTENSYSLDYIRYSGGNIAYRYYERYRYKSRGSEGFDVFSLTAATELFPTIKAGVSINKWFNGCTTIIEESYSVIEKKYWSDEGTRIFKDKIDMDISGISVDFGILIRIFRNVNLGFVYKSGFEADIDYSNLAEYTVETEDYSFHQQGSTSGKGKIVLPSSFGMGISFYPMKNLLFSLDYMRSDWSGGKIKDYSRANSAAGVSEKQELRYPSFKLPDIYEQLDSQQLRFGAEYKLKIKGITIPLRAGIFKDFQYSVDSKSDQIIYRGFSIGSGFHHKNYYFDVAFVNEHGSYYYAFREAESNFISFFSSAGYKF
jgi:long-subunit fatty acid transport protein